MTNLTGTPQKIPKLNLKKNLKKKALRFFFKAWHPSFYSTTN